MQGSGDPFEIGTSVHIRSIERIDCACTNRRCSDVCHWRRGHSRVPIGGAADAAQGPAIPCAIN